MVMRCISSPSAVAAEIQKLFPLAFILGKRLMLPPKCETVVAYN